MSQEKTDLGKKVEKWYESCYEQEIKFCYFITGLSFAILGLSIQTTPPTICVYLKIIELVSWFGFLLAGSSGIFYLKSEYESLYAFGDSLSAKYQNNQKLMEERDKKLMEERDKRIKRVFKSSKIALNIRNWAFMISIVFLAISRGYIALMTS